MNHLVITNDPSLLRSGEPPRCGFEASRQTARHPANRPTGIAVIKIDL
jgi:hypothetical protein